MMENQIKNKEISLRKKLGNTPGFSLPEKYFDTIEDSVDIKLFEEQKSSKLPYDVPTSYFSQLEDVLSKRVSPNKPEVISLTERVQKIAPYVAAAAIVVFIMLNSFSFSSGRDITFDSLSDNDLEYWMDYNILDNNDVALVLGEDIANENEFSFTELTDENIEDYIQNSDFLNEIN